MEGPGLLGAGVDWALSKIFSEEDLCLVSLRGRNKKDMKT